MAERLHPLFERLTARTGLVLTVIGLLTAALIVPFLTMAPDVSASTEPTGDVFTARDRIDDSFVSSVHLTGIIVEHESGDLLTVDALGSLLEAQTALRQDPELAPTLLQTFDAETASEVDGLLSLADLVDAELRDQGVDGIGAATDAEVRATGSAVIDRLGERNTLIQISAQSTRADDGWTVPALTLFVLSDNEQLGFGATSVNLGGDTDVEEYDRDLQEIFRVEGWQANGIAIDVNLTSQEQGAVAGPFIGFTILAVLLILGLTFRSYWVLATASVAFLVLIVWLKGISNLIGLKDDLVLSLIVPIAMVSFGVDFAFHAVGRYREERTEGRSAQPAFVAGMAAVSGALILALISDATAFLANLTSGIESINQFGIGAAIALASAYLLLGIATPLVVSRIEATVPAPTAGRRSTILRLAGAVGAGAMTMASVLLLVFILPWLGTIMAAVTGLTILVAPWLIRRRRLDAASTGGHESTAAAGHKSIAAAGDVPMAAADDRLAVPIGRVVSSLARNRLIVLPISVAITALALVYALRVPAEFDVEDFFSTDTDFVVGLEQLDTHVGDRGGEPALLYVEGDLSDPAVLAEIQATIDEIRQLEDGSLARDRDGQVQIEGGIFEVLDATWDSEPMAGIVAQQTGVELTDSNGDRIPDTREQIDAVLAVASEIGVPFDDTRPLLTPDDVNTVIAFDGEEARTVFEMGVVNSRTQQSVTATRDVLQPIADRLSEELGSNFVQVTGSAFVREASLEATNRALQVSLPVALALCLLVGSIFLRSIRYGVASIIPIIMVVTWLYAFMYLAGFAINLVTATIAAVSIGIGIDFAIHYIARYRQELDRLGQRDEAIRVTSEGTGLALVASAASSAVGFGILALAPMPLFAAYGLLTALMIVLALIATLAVLPSILVTITADQSPDTATDTATDTRLDDGPISQPDPNDRRHDPLPQADGATEGDADLHVEVTAD